MGLFTLLSTFNARMKKLITALFIMVSFYGQSQLQDTNYTNIFSNVSDYRNYNEVYLTNLGLAKFNLFSPFDDNNPEVKNLFPSKSNSKTYTDIFYLLGSGKENYFTLEHHQKLGKNLYGEASIFKTNSTGIYSSQVATLSNIEISLAYTPIDKRYNFEAGFKNYKRNNDINGGVADSSFFSLLDSSNSNVKTTFPIQMQPAVSTNPNSLDIKVMDLNFSHSFGLSKTKNDSLGYLQLTQSLGYKRTKQSFYVSSNNGYFSDYFYDSITTNDSLRLEKLTHTIGIDYVKNNSVFSAGVGQNYFEYVSYSPFEVHLENFIYGSYLFKGNKFELNSEASLITSNGKYESYNFTNSFSYVDTSLSIFNAYAANITIGTNQPELYYNNYTSNHYQWSRVNDLNTIIKANLTGFNLGSKTSLGIDYESQSNSIYWDTTSQIDQTAVSVVGVTLQKEFKFTKSLYLTSSVRFQEVFADETIELPNFVTFNKLYFKGKIFKKVLSFDAGINVLYYSSFYSKAYNPALDKFYVQEDQKVGNYLIFDLFAEFYLKNSFSFFISANHVNSNIFTENSINNIFESLKIKKRVDFKDNFGKNYLATTSNPLQDRAFKFGFKWRLFD